MKKPCEDLFLPIDFKVIEKGKETVDLMEIFKKP